MRNERTVGCMVNLQGSVVDRWRADGGTGRIAARRRSEYRRNEALPEEAEETPEAGSLDELVVGRDPAVGGEDHELEAGAEHLAIR